MTDLCILGLGYIGLPTACMFASSGLSVVGVDIDTALVEALNEGKVLIKEPGLDVLALAAIRKGAFSATMTPVRASSYIIAVPTPFADGHRADLSAVKAACKAVSRVLSPGALVILESTSPPGTTVDVVRPILEESGLKAGVDFHLCYSPERVLPGRILDELINNDRVVGGFTPACSERAESLYRTFVKGSMRVTDPTTAEMVKLMENTFRDVNIGLANEFALIAERVGIDVWEAIELANHHKRVHILNPGPGVGGHCIAVDPWFLVEAAPEQTNIIRAARNVNDAMPEHVISSVNRWAGHSDRKSKIIGCLGLSFKSDVDDIRESPAVQVAETLVLEGYKVRAYDPYVSGVDTPFRVAESLEECLVGADLMLLLVDHAYFRDLDPLTAVQMRGRDVIDTRNCLVRSQWTDAGFNLRVLGCQSELEPQNKKTVVA